MVWISNLGQLRCSALLALIVVERRLVALLFLMVGVFRLTTPLLRQWLMIHPRPSAGLRLSGGFGYPNAPSALFHRREILRGSLYRMDVGLESSTP